jgi:lipoprotein-releasing system ATP-binding protein
MAALMKVEELRKSFASGAETLRVLRGVGFDLAEGEFLSVVGQSGAGKSTLLHIMGGLDRPDGGRVMFRDRDVFVGTAAELDRYRNRDVGFIFQFHHLMPEFTALENVMMPALVAKRSRDEARREAASWLAEVGLSQRLEHRPGQLSGGEQQRVAVARALVMSPAVLLADEPTGNLDQENSQAVFRLLQDINRRRRLSVVMVTHNAELAAAADRMMRLANGMLV